MGPRRRWAADQARDGASHRAAVAASVYKALYTEPFGKQTQWRAFVRKSRLTDAPDDFADVVTAIAPFLLPVAEAVADGAAFRQRWTAGKRWAHG